MSQVKDPACDPLTALVRARSAMTMGGQYVLGTGDYNEPDNDLPWTTNKYGTGSDCAGFAICYAWMLKRHRPGFNVGSWASVSDDINCNSMLEDAQHAGELGAVVSVGARPGDLLLYPTIRIKGLEFVGHVCIIENVPAGWVVADGYHHLTVLQCHGPNGFKPAVVRTDGSIWDHHDSVWPKDEHRSHIVRPHVRS